MSAQHAETETLPPRRDEPSVREGTRGSALFTCLYLGALAIGAPFAPRLGIPSVALHGLVLVTLLAHGALTTHPRRREILLSITPVPLAAILAAAISGRPMSEMVAAVVVMALVCVGLVRIARQLGYSRRDLGLRLTIRGALSVIPLVAIGAQIGMLEYDLRRPLPLADSMTPEAAWPAALGLLFTTGIAEELVYRGLLQRATVRAFGPVGGVVLTAAIFGLLADGVSLSPERLGLAVLAGLVFGLTAYWSRSIVGPIAGHATINIVLFLVAPFLVPSPTAFPPLEAPTAGAAVSARSPSPVAQAAGVGGRAPAGVVPAIAPSPVAAAPAALAPSPAASGPAGGGVSGGGPAGSGPPPATRVALLLPPASPVVLARSSPLDAPAAGSAARQGVVRPPRLAAARRPGWVSISDDGGVTWAERAAPTSDPILSLYVGADDRDELQLLTAEGYYLSLDAGAGWLKLRSAPPDARFVQLVLSDFRNVIALDRTDKPLQIALSGEPLEFPDLDPPVDGLVAVAADIQSDRFYAYDAQGRTFVMASPGDDRMVEATPLPDDVTPAARGLVADADAEGQLLVISADGSRWRSRDGFASEDGYARQP
jgi:membrane protease YdiL (CAAX protease family)